jgi:hypothetical protein
MSSTPDTPKVTIPAGTLSRTPSAALSFAVHPLVDPAILILRTCCATSNAVGKHRWIGRHEPIIRSRCSWISAPGSRLACS